MDATNLTVEIVTNLISQKKTINSQRSSGSKNTKPKSKPKK